MASSQRAVPVRDRDTVPCLVPATQARTAPARSLASRAHMYATERTAHRPGDPGGLCTCHRPGALAALGNGKGTGQDKSAALLCSPAIEPVTAIESVAPCSTVSNVSLPFLKVHQWRRFWPDSLRHGRDLGALQSALKYQKSALKSF
jgi:hypothetical protein